MNVLILDEPTNHLDIDSRAELENYLKEFKGTLLIVSHDRYFINNIASRVVELCQSSLISYGGNYEYYKEKSAQIKNALLIKKVAQETNKSKVKKEETPKIINNPCKQLNLEKQIEELEENLKAAESEIVEYSHNYEKLAELFSDKLDLQKSIEKLMEEYFD